MKRLHFPVDPFAIYCSHEYKIHSRLAKALLSLEFLMITITTNNNKTPGLMIMSSKQKWWFYYGRQEKQNKLFMNFRKDLSYIIIVDI